MGDDGKVNEMYNRRNTSQTNKQTHTQLEWSKALRSKTKLRRKVKKFVLARNSNEYKCVKATEVVR